MRLQPFTLSLLLLLVLISCSREADKFNLQPEYHAGDTGLYTLRQEETVTEKDSAGKDLSSKTIMEMQVRDRVKSLDEAGNANASFLYTRISMESDIPGYGKMYYSTDTLPRNPMEESVMRMTRQKITVRQDRSGHILEISGADSLFMDMFSDSSFTSNQMVKEILEAEAWIPDHPVAKGETWAHSFKSSAYYPMLVTDSLRIVSADDKEIGIEFEGSIRPNPDSKAVMDPGYPVDYALSGKRSGKYFLSAKDKSLIRSELKTEMSGDKIDVTSGKKSSIRVSRNETATYQKLQ